MGWLNGATRRRASEERLRVMQFITLFAIGGTERQLMELVRHYDRERFALHVGCFRRWGSYLAELESLGLPISDYGIQSLVGTKTIGRQLELARYLRRNRIDVLQTQGFYPNVFGMVAGFLADTPLRIASIRDQGHNLSAPRRHLQRLVCRLAHRVVVNADAIRKHLVADGWEAGKITVIHNGIDLSHLEPTVGADVRGRLGVPLGAPIVAVLARLDPVKDIDTFLEAARLVASRFPEARFVLVGDDCGDGSYRRRLEAKVAELELGQRVVFAGFTLEVGAYLREVAVSVLPSTSEGLSNTLLESSGAGVAVVATNVGGNPEIVVQGVTGLLVPPRRPQALAAAIGRLLADPGERARYGAAGRRHVRETFSTENMVRRSEKLWTEALEDR